MIRLLFTLFFVIVAFCLQAQWQISDKSTDDQVKIAVHVTSEEDEDIQFGMVHFGDEKQWFVNGIPIWSKVQLQLDSAIDEVRKYSTKAYSNYILIKDLSGDILFEEKLNKSKSLTVIVSKGSKETSYTFHIANNEKSLTSATEDAIRAYEDQPKKDNSIDLAALSPGPDVNGVWKIVDEMPLFGNCKNKACSDNKLINYVVENITYPKKARKKGIQGKVFVRFIVEKDGTVSNVILMREIGGGCGDVALDMVKRMNKLGKPWTPGMNKGEPVRVYYTLPVSFMLE